MAWRPVDAVTGYCGMAGAPGIVDIMSKLVATQGKLQGNIGQPSHVMIHHEFPREGEPS